MFIQGDDVLIGGTGNDRLYGDKGNDTYIFSKDDGKDLISDWQGNNRMIFTNVALTEASFRKNGNELIIDYGAGDSITINFYFDGPAYQMQSITFSDQTLTSEDVLSLVNGQAPLSTIAGHNNDFTGLVNQEVQSLINAMASFEATAGTETSLVRDEHSLLGNSFITSSSLG